MKLHSAHPKPRRSKLPIVLLLLLVILVGGLFFLSGAAEPVQTQTIEEEIASDAQ